MCARELSMSIVTVIRVFLLAAFVVYAPQAQAISSMDTSSTDPSYLTLGEFKKHVHRGSLKWSVSRVAGSHEKRLTPIGLINSQCVTGASMELVKHPLANKTNELFVVAKLNDNCQEATPGEALVKAKNVDPALDRTGTVDVSSMFDLRIPSDFEGTVHFCALKEGSTIITPGTFNDRVVCEKLPIEGVGEGVVDANNEILSVTAIALAEQEAKEKREAAEQRRRELRRIADVANILKLYGSSCKNVARRNAALRQLGSFGINYSQFIAQSNENALDEILGSLEKAKSLEEVNALITDFDKLTRGMRDVDPAKFYEEAIKKMESLVEAAIENIDDMDSSEARRAERDIKNLRRLSRTLLGSGSKGEVDRMTRDLYGKLANRASKLGDLDQALEVAERAEEMLPKELGLDFIEAQRNALVKQYKKCVNKRAEKGSIDKCTKIRRKAEKVQKDLEDDADDYASDSDKERYEEDGEELFGQRYGLVRTPFGYTVQQPSYGELDLFGLEALQAAQLGMFGGGNMSLTSLLLGGGGLNQMSLLGLNNGLASPLLGGGMRSMSPARQSPLLGYGALGATPSLGSPLSFR